VRTARIRARVKGTGIYADIPAGPSRLGADIPSGLSPLGADAAPGQGIDPTSQEFAPIQGSPYTTVGGGPRSRAWRPGGWGPAAAVDYSLNGLIRQSRDLMRQNGDAATIRARLTANVIGAGIVAEIPDAAVRKAWRDWCGVAAIDGTLDWHGIQAQVMDALVEAGEVLVRRRILDDEPGVPLRLQVLESEYLVLEKNEITPDGGYIRQGVEFDAEGRRVAYWIYPIHPQDIIPGQYNALPIRVPAGEILHIFRPDRPGQIRGVPWLSAVMAALKELGDYKDAELVRKKVSALFTAFVENPYPDGLDAEDVKKLFPHSPTDDVVAMEPGTVQVLDPGQKVTFAAPADVGGQYNDFMKVQYRAIAAATGILYEQMTGDYSSGNDRLYRAAFNEFRRRVRMVQHHIIIHQLCQGVGRWWWTLAQLTGAIPLSAILDALSWVPEAWPYINPVQDVAAKVAEVRAGFTSRTRVVGERGHNAADVDAETAADRQRADSMGLVYDTDPKQVDDQGQAQPTAPDPDSEEKDI